MLFAVQSWDLDLEIEDLADEELVCRRHPWLFVADHWLAKEIQWDQSVFSFEEMIGGLVLIWILDIQEDLVLRGLRIQGLG